MNCTPPHAQHVSSCARAQARAPVRARPQWAPLLATALTLLVTGCGHSPPTQFFTLAAVRPDTAQRSYAGAPLQVRAVHIPAVLDRPERVVARSPQRLDILETQQWGGPLDDMIRRVLSRDLTTRLPAGMVLLANAPAAGSRGIVIDIQEFQPETGGNVVLDASWVVIGAGQGNQPITRGQRRLQLHSGAGADAQVAAMSALLGQLADAIVASLKST